MSRCACETCGCLITFRQIGGVFQRYYCAHHNFCGADFEKAEGMKYIGCFFGDGFPEETPPWCPKEVQK